MLYDSLSIKRDSPVSFRKIPGNLAYTAPRTHGFGHPTPANTYMLALYLPPLGGRGAGTNGRDQWAIPKPE